MWTSGARTGLNIDVCELAEISPQPCEKGYYHCLFTFGTVGCREGLQKSRTHTGPKNAEADAVLLRTTVLDRDVSPSVLLLCPHLYATPHFQLTNSNTGDEGP